MEDKEPIAKLKEKLESGDPLQFQFYAFTSRVEEFLTEMVRVVLERCGREGQFGVLYTVVKDLVINAVKANQKRIFFSQRNLDITNPDDYKTGVHEYKISMDSAEVDQAEYSNLARQANVFVLVQLECSDEKILIHVKNNTLYTNQEEKVIRKCLAKARFSHDIQQFYLSQSESGTGSEGAGLGLALVCILLNSEGIDPKYFSIFTEDGMTVARVEIPLKLESEEIRN